MMHKIKPILKILSIITVIISSNSFGAVSHNQSCSFPLHFTITGPENTHIISMRLNTRDQPIYVSNLTDKTFDIQVKDEEKNNCEEIDLFGIHLKVGTDNNHFDETYMGDFPGFPLILLDHNPTNGFSLNKINDSNHREFEINYRQDQ